MNALVKEWREANMAARPKVILQLAPRFFNFDVMDYVIGRTIMLYDGSVEQLVLVIPHLTDEKRKYIREQLATGFLDLDPIAAGRLKLISPETAKCFVPGSSVAAMLQSSHKALAQVKSILDGRLSFLMTDTIGRAEIGLSSLLDIPVIGSKPEKAKRINTRHKARVFLRNAGFEVVPGMSFKPGPQYKLKEVLLHLTAKYQTNVAFWEIFEKRRSSQMDFAKPDCAFDASIDFESVPHLTAFDEETVDEAASKFNLQEILHYENAQHTSTSSTESAESSAPNFPSLKQKEPEASSKPAPSTTAHSYAESKSVLLAKDFEQIGFVVPQQRLPHAMLMKIVDRLLTNCTKAGIFGNGWWTNNLYPFLSPTLLKASSVLVSSGCEIDAKTGISSFQWTDIPLHLERTQNAVFTDHPLLRADFEHNIIKQAGGETEQRVAIYAENLRSEEIVRLTWRGFVQTCQRDGVRFNEKTRKGTYFPLVNPDIPMLMPMVTMGSDYKSTIAAFLKDLTICHRRLKHYDCIDLVSNVKDTARFLFKNGRTDAYASIFNLKRAPSEVPGDDSGNANKTPMSRRKNFSKISSDAAEPLQLQLLKRQHSSMAAGAGIKSVKEDLISSDSDDSFSEEKVEQRGSIPYLAGNRGDEIPVIRPLTAEEKNEFFDLHKLRTIRLADKPQPPAWWDTLHFHPVDPTGKIHHIDAYDPKNPSQKHFELNPDVHPLAHEDLDTLVASLFHRS
ncbi:hypothetical protein BCR33DRAFT_785522 [Rhizoclosmatium globosum]|uniref:Uncharacterized protein n=1 Tax=Rhizoclosmatium globosum TaxID=329046 RepID=A0A1Y2C9H5_9FUNG|nr:hypothetical protein BCR33DRAFT_785522 [Rhizoclosmatium globosum]|eukprot:ORY43688.1 hypothetical protein BCR33DRAFT_785522 [Rhizoclosmatium globosum]